MSRHFGVAWSGVVYDYLEPQFEGFTDDYMVVVSTSHEQTAKSEDIRDAKGVLLEASAAVHGWKDTLQLVLRSRVTGTIPGVPNHDVHNGGDGTCCLDEIAIHTAKGEKSTLTVSAHMHRKPVNGSLAIQQHQTVSGQHYSLPAFAGFGVSTFGLSSLGVAAASLQSGTYTIKFLHADADGLDGNYLCGKTYGAVATASFEAIDDTDWNTPSGWTRKADGSADSNTVHGRRTATFEKVIF